MDQGNEKLEKKILAFEYIMWRLIEWYKDTQKVSYDDALKAFDRLKAMKLLFFVSAVEAKDGKIGLLDTFDKFYAMPYGHVEGDVYRAISNNDTRFFNFTGNEAIERKKTDFTGNDTSFLDSAIDATITQYPDLVSKYTSLQLVDLSHRWFSWRWYFNEARKKGIYSEAIPNDIIIKEEKLFIY